MARLGDNIIKFLSLFHCLMERFSHTIVLPAELAVEVVFRD
jgi:hypothetical protein